MFLLGFPLHLPYNKTLKQYMKWTFFDNRADCNDSELSEKGELSNLESPGLQNSISVAKPDQKKNLVVSNELIKVELPP